MLIAKGGMPAAAFWFGDIRRVAYVVLGMLLPTGAASQEAATRSLFWGPPEREISVGVSAVADDSESSTPLGVWWYGGERLSVGMTGQFWTDYHVVQTDVRWFVGDSSKVRPFLTTGVSWQTHGSSEGYGLTAGVGGEIYVFKYVALSLALGWRSLYRRGREGAGVDPQNIHWFRITQTLMVFPMK